MIQTELKPVTVYRSTDTGAPQLTNAVGSLKTVLKACLVEGYGSQPSLGWEMPFENTTTAVFKSKDPKSPNAALRVKNHEKLYAELAMMVAPTSLDAAEKIAEHGSARLFPYLQTSKANTKWMLVGHGRAFVLLVQGSYKTRFIWFGDFPTLAAGDTGNCALLYSSDGTYKYLTINSSTFRIPKLLGYFGGGSNNTAIIAKSSTGLSLGLTDCVLSSLCGTFASLSFPDTITNGLSISECYLHEFDGRTYPMRGLLPGMYACANNLSSVEDWSEMGDFMGSSDRFVNCCFEDSSSSSAFGHFLIDTTAWRV
nr:MAG TPA: hypothetical protein [Caudoviricetes sp.]